MKWERSGRLAGKGAVIVGAGQTPGPDVGNGRAMAIRFAREGARLVLTARHPERAEETARMILAEMPDAEVYTFALDVTKENEVRALMDFASEKLGYVDILVDNVGIMLPADSSLLTVEEETYTVMMDTNEKSALYLLRNAAPRMAERGGSILLISSIAGTCVGGGANTYNLSKGGMLRLGQLFAGMLAKDGIRVNTIVLGLVQTSMALTHNEKISGRSREEVIASRDASVPLKGGQGTAWDTAAAALFLSSDEARFITGACLPVDGGSSMLHG